MFKLVRKKTLDLMRRLADTRLQVIARQQEVIAVLSQTVELYKKLNAVLEPFAVAHADAVRPASWLNPNWDGVVVLRKSWQVAHNHDWN
jgi:hypothetical protein